MSETDIKIIISELNRWALGHLGSKLTWAILEDRFGFSRQSLQAKSEIKAGYDNAKQALSGGLIKSTEQASKENEILTCETKRLISEIEEFKRKEIKWKKRWQCIAFHVRQKGMQMNAVDRDIPEGAGTITDKEASSILKPFDNKIPLSGRI
jgi:hypothetical protein